jgi:serine/threonine protein kinase
VDRDVELSPTLPVSGDEVDGARGTYGRFISLGVIGRGGMGIVLRARDPELDRDVAIKLLGRSPAEGDHASGALQREAQAMAKLSHPNVVTVYEMGEVGGERFIAMELVEGTTLRKWLAADRPWRDVLDALVACGRGLAAAHTAGLVHRDFKPENVLIGADGRPRVSDFGLVMTGVAVEGNLGSVAGTPAYMAPEQWAGDEIDARADQFAFCVVAWEALFGERPYPGETSNELRANVIAGKPQAPARDRGAAWVEPILRRGLASDRDARWPSMSELLAALDRRPRRRWPWAVGVLGVAGVAAALVAVARTPESDPCPDPEARLQAIWDLETQHRLAAAFAKVNPALANETLARIVPDLDRYAARWREASRAACRATRVDGTQSAELLDRRMLCLDRRRDELATVTSGLLAADRERVATAVDTVGSLGDLDQCANREMLLALAPPTDSAQRTRVDELEAEVRASEASRFTSKPAERQARAAAAVTAARGVGYLPLTVRALEESYGAALDNSDDVAAEAALRELAQRAAEAHDDVLAARAWTNAISLLARKKRFAEAKTLEPVAEAAVARAGSTPALRYGLTAAIGVRRMHNQELAPGIAALQTALELATTDAQRAEARQVLAQATMMKDGPKHALPLAEQSLAATEKAYGPTHPRTAARLHLVAQLQTSAGDLVRAHEAETRAIAIREAYLGVDHLEVASSLHTLGNIASRRGDHPAARKAWERAIAIYLARDDINGAANTRGMLATLVSRTEGIDAARPIFVASLAGLEATIGKEQINYLQTEANFASHLITAGKCDEAAPLLAHAVAVSAKVMPRQLPMMLEAAARCDIAMGRTREAIAKLERGISSCKEQQCPPPIPEGLAWRLGKTLVDSGGDRARGLALVDEATAVATKHEVADLLAEIAAWRKALATSPPRRR